MVCRTESKEIGEHEYSVTQWPAEKSMLMKFKLIKTFGPSLTSLISVASSESKDEGAEAVALSNGLSVLFQSSSPEELVALMKSCIVGVARDGKRITDTSFAELFSGDDLLDIYKIFIFVIQVNYSNFIKGQLADKFMATMKENL